MNANLENHAREIYAKAKKGEPLTKNEIKILEEQILVCLRDKDDQLVRSELLNYPRGTNE